MGKPTHDDRRGVAVRDDYDPEGRKWITLFDPERPEAWLRVPYLEGSPPDFSDPATWEHLRRERSKDRESWSRFRRK